MPNKITISNTMKKIDIFMEVDWGYTFWIAMRPFQGFKFNRGGVLVVLQASPLLATPMLFSLSMFSLLKKYDVRENERVAFLQVRV